MKSRASMLGCQDCHSPTLGVFCRVITKTCGRTLSWRGIGFFLLTNAEHMCQSFRRISSIWPQYFSIVIILLEFRKSWLIRSAADHQTSHHDLLLMYSWLGELLVSFLIVHPFSWSSPIVVQNPFFVTCYESFQKRDVFVAQKKSRRYLRETRICTAFSTCWFDVEDSKSFRLWLLICLQALELVYVESLPIEPSIVLVLMLFCHQEIPQLWASHLHPETPRTSVAAYIRFLFLHRLCYWYNGCFVIQFELVR